MPVISRSYLAAQVIRLLPRKTLSRLAGAMCDAHLPTAVGKAVVRAYCRAYAIDLSEVEPSARFTSFDAFFTRQLREGSRPIERSNDDVLSPADGFLQAVGRVEPGRQIVVKGRAYDLRSLLGDAQEAQTYEGGQFAVVYLSPRDYHRVHAPVNGAVKVVRSIAGEYYPVNEIGEKWFPDLFVANRRVVIVQHSPTMGPVTTIMVAALIVGRITVAMVPGNDVAHGLHILEPPFPLLQGDEIGAFHLGSTAVVVAGRDAPPWQRGPGLIRVGQSLVRTG